MEVGGDEGLRETFRNFMNHCNKYDGHCGMVATAMYLQKLFVGKNHFKQILRISFL